MRIPMVSGHPGMRGIGSDPILIPEPPVDLTATMFGQIPAMPSMPSVPLRTSTMSAGIAPGENENAARFATLGSRPSNAWSAASPQERAAFLSAMRNLPWAERYTMWPEFQTSTNLSNLSFSLMGGALAIVFVLIITSKK